MTLWAIGWTVAWQNAFSQWGEGDHIPARVIREHRGAYALLADAGECLAEVSGRFRHQARTRQDFPAVGDWVVAERADSESRAIIHAILPRHSAFLRRSAGTKGEEQIVAAHVDIGQQGNFNIESGDKGLVFCIYIVLLYSQILI